MKVGSLPQLSNRCIHEFFEEQARSMSNRLALCYEDQQLTFGELNSQANQIAHYLRKRGARPEVLIGLCLERSLESIVAVIGILKVGSGYVPLAPTHPAGWLKNTILEHRIELVLTTSSLEHLVETGRS